MGAYNPFPLGKNGYGSNNRKMKHWLIQSELRYWLCERFNGHFFGGHLFYGQYNVSNIRYWGLGDFRRQEILPDSDSVMGISGFFHHIGV